MADITDNLRSHFEEKGMALHPKNEYFDPVIHPNRRGVFERELPANSPEFAFTYRGEEDHHDIQGMMHDALRHVTEGKSGSEGYAKDDKDDPEYETGSPMETQRRFDLDGNRWLTAHHFESGDGSVYHMEHHTYREGANSELGLKGTPVHHVAVFKLF